MGRTGMTVLGLLLIAAGVAGWFLLPERGEIAAMVFVGLGGFFVSRSQMVEFARAVVELVRGIRA